ncbi:MAG TPA: hypothetical protein VIU61_21040 [Kofleriaceae bacterium]
MAVLGDHRALIAALIAGLAGCYSPELTDCTVTCSSVDDCAGDQVCSDGLCASSGIVCSEPGPDPNPTGPDGGPDADPIPTRVTLRVEVDGDGKVVVEGINAGSGTCISEPGGEHVEICQFNVTEGATLALEALMLVDKPFDKWSQSCEGQDATCALRATTSLVARAKFK